MHRAGERGEPSGPLPWLWPHRVHLRLSHIVASVVISGCQAVTASQCLFHSITVQRNEGGDAANRDLPREAIQCFLGVKT